MDSVENQPTMEQRYVAARALYEGTPGMTMKQLSVETGITKGSLDTRSRAEGWKKNSATARLGPLTERAQAAADAYGARVKDSGPELSEDQRGIAVEETIAEVAIDERAQLIDRHRREWAAPRKLAYEAMQSRDFEKAKLAKISSESLQIIQTNERKAWGILAGDEEKPLLIIERDSN